MQKLVSRKKHRDAVSEHEQAEEILCLPLAQRECLVGKQFVPFDSAVETIAVSRSICILVPVCLVVAVFIRNHVPPSKSRRVEYVTYVFKRGARIFRTGLE